MENLNTEQIIKALECCKTSLASDCENCSYTGKRPEDGVYEGCVHCLVGDALALITSQEQRIAELTEENERLRAKYEKAQIFSVFPKEEELKYLNALERMAKEYKTMRANIVRKYKSAIIEYYSKPKYQPTKEHPIKHTQIEYLFAVLDQIAKETLDTDNVIKSTTLKKD